MNGKKQQQTNYFLFQQSYYLYIFLNLHVGQHNLFSQFTTKENTIERTI